MKLRTKIMFSIMAAATTVALSVGITFAANYVAPPEETNYEYGSMPAADKNFQDLSYYFDKDSGIAEFNAVGDGSTNAYTLDATPTSIIAVSVDGVAAAYELSGKVVTFTVTPANTAAVHVSYRTRPGVSVAPFLIKNSQHLRNLSKLQNSGAFPDGLYVSLATSFEYEGATMEPIGTYKYPFTGVFNGQNRLITGLKVSTNIVEVVNSVNTAYVGMFGVVGTNTKTGTIHSLILAGPDIRYTGSAAVKIGIVAGSRNTTAGHVSVIENIEIYGGTSSFKATRAHIQTGSGSVTSSVFVGENGVTRNVGFVNSISSNPTYTSTYNYDYSTNPLAASSNYYLWLNGTTVTNSN